MRRKKRDPTCVWQRANHLGRIIGPGVCFDRVGTDFLVLSDVPGWSLRWIHRHVEDAEVYLVANPNSRELFAECQFRVAGKIPELWHADTGKTEPAAVWKETEQVTRVRLHLEARGSVFVVFRRNSSGADPVAEVTYDGRRNDAVTLTATSGGSLGLLVSRPGKYSIALASGRKIDAKIDSVPPTTVLNGTWDVSFPRRSGPPDHISLTSSRPGPGRPNRT